MLKEEAPGQPTRENCDRTVSFYGDASEKGLRDSGIESSFGKVRFIIYVIIMHF